MDKKKDVLGGNPPRQHQNKIHIY